MKSITCLFLLCLSSFSISKGIQGIKYHQEERINLDTYFTQEMNPNGEINHNVIAMLIDCDADPSQAFCTCKPYDNASKSLCNQFRNICDKKPSCTSSETPSEGVKCIC